MPYPRRRSGEAPRCALLGALAGPCSPLVLSGCPLADLQDGSPTSSASWCQREQAGAAFCADLDEAGWTTDGQTLTLTGSYGPPLGSPSPARSTNASMHLGDIATSPPFSF